MSSDNPLEQLNMYTPLYVGLILHTSSSCNALSVILLELKIGRWRGFNFNIITIKVEGDLGF
jgi:hypothetical protein